MPNYKYLVVGGGMAADAAIGGIRQIDSAGAIGLVGDEAHPPYNRPPLSKGLWKGKPVETVWRRNANHEAVAHLGRRAVAVDLASKTVTDNRGTLYTFQKLLLATGGTPRRMPAGDGEVLYFRTLDDYYRLRLLTEQRQRIAVIGGGFIGTEIAAALRTNAKDVVLVFPEAGIGARQFPADLVRWLNDFYREKGVELLPGQSVVKTGSRGEQLTLTTRDVATQEERTLKVDGIVAGLGIRPNVELAQAAGLTVDDGIRVDASLRSSHPDVYAAGDVASFFNPALDKHLRVEHEDNANTMGQMAGQAMAGQDVRYDHLPYFYSDLFEVGYEAVGELDPQMETVADWKEPYRQGVVYYLRDGRVRGVLLWNVWEQVATARQLIAAPGPFRPADLRGRITA